MKKLTLILFLALTPLMSRAQIHYIQDMSTVEIASLDRDKTVILLPGGILEEHGPYLPAFTDGYMNQSLTSQIANAIVKRPGWNVLIFPLIPLGNGGANEIGRKYSFSGSYTIRHNVLASLLMDLASEFGEQGFKKIVVVHIHGGPNHNLAIDQACSYFSDTYKGWMVNIWNLAFSYSENTKSEIEKKEDGYTVHAGFTEHSILYSLKPDLLKAGYTEARPLTASSPEDLVRLAKEKDWPGYFGSPRLSNLNRGVAYWKGWSQYVLNQVEEIMDNKYDFSKPTYFQVTSTNPVFKLIIEDGKKYDSEKEAKQTEWLKSKGFN